MRAIFLPTPAAFFPRAPFACAFCEFQFPLLKAFTDVEYRNTLVKRLVSYNTSIIQRLRIFRSFDVHFFSFYPFPPIGCVRLQAEWKNLS